MARGPYYTKEEDERLLALWNDLKDQSPTLKEVAVKAVAYGICDRNPDAVAQHLAVLLAPKVEEPDDADEAQLEIDVEKASISKRASELETKYNGLLHAVVDCASLYEGSLYDGLKYNYKEITRWLTDNEPEKFGAKLEELQMQVN